mgnify:CR=1 FL=1
MHTSVKTFGESGHHHDEPLHYRVPCSPSSYVRWALKRLAQHKLWSGSAEFRVWTHAAHAFQPFTPRTGGCVHFRPAEAHVHLKRAQGYYQPPLVAPPMSFNPNSKGQPTDVYCYYTCQCQWGHWSSRSQLPWWCVYLLISTLWHVDNVVLLMQGLKNTMWNKS